MDREEIEKRFENLNKYCKYVKKKDGNFYILGDKKMVVSNAEGFYFCNKHSSLILETTAITENCRLTELKEGDIFMWFSEEYFYDIPSLCYGRIHIFQGLGEKGQIYTSRLKENFGVEFIDGCSFVGLSIEDKENEEHRIVIFK